MTQSFTLLKNCFRLLVVQLMFPGVTSLHCRCSVEHSRVKQASLELKILYHSFRGVHFKLLVPAAAV